MQRTWMGLLAVTLISLASAGCQNKLAAENRNLWAQNRELQARLASSEQAPKTDPAQLSQLQQQIAERDAKIAELQNQLREPGAGQSEPQIANIETSYDQASGKMTVAVPGDVLFAAGDAKIRDDAKSTLDKVVPNRARLLATLRELGFEPEVLPVRFGPQIGLPAGDSYAEGKRITILARKVRVPAGRSRDTVVLGGAR